MLFPSSAPIRGLELPVLGGDVRALQGAQKLVVAQPQVLEAWWRVIAQTLHAGDVVAVQLQHLQGRKGACEPSTTRAPRPSSPGHSAEEAPTCHATSPGPPDPPMKAREEISLHRWGRTLHNVEQEVILESVGGDMHSTWPRVSV